MYRDWWSFLTALVVDTYSEFIVHALMFEFSCFPVSYSMIPTYKYLTDVVEIKFITGFDVVFSIWIRDTKKSNKVDKDKNKSTHKNTKYNIYYL